MTSCARKVLLGHLHHSRGLSCKRLPHPRTKPHTHQPLVFELLNSVTPLLVSSSDQMHLLNNHIWILFPSYIYLKP